MNVLTPLLRQKYSGTAAAGFLCLSTCHAGLINPNLIMGDGSNADLVPDHAALIEHT